MSMGLAHLPLHPDVVSFVAFVVAAVGAWSLAVGAGLAGALLVHASSVLDGVDGEIARLRLRAGPRGALLDGVLDRLGDVLVLAALGLWAIRGGADPKAVMVLAVAATAGSMLSMASKDRIAALGLPPPPERWIGWLMGGRDARLLIVAVCALLGEPAAALVAIAITTTLSLAARLALSRLVDGSWAGPS
jgi:CDP-L-myo-inositol myo-inositolphosphotransferase